MERIGIYGGTFNPVQIAHLIIAEQFAEEMELDKCILVPAAVSPFKTGSHEKEDVSAAHRLEMLSIAAGGNPLFQIDPFEIEHGGVSYSIETVNYVHEKNPEAGLFLLIGGDNARDFTKWKNWKRILELVTLCIARRPGTINDETESKITCELTIDERPPVWLDTPLMEISSSDIRKMIALGKSIKYLVPPGVEKYIRKNRLYK